MDKNVTGQEAVELDEDIQKGYDVYRDIDTKANKKAEEIANSIINDVINTNNIDDFNISIAILAISKVLTHLSSYLYDTEESFLEAVEKARTAVPTDIIPALLRPEPCGICDNCKNGKSNECLNPKVRGDHTQSNFLPILSNMIIEYDLFNKILWMHTVGKAKEENKDESSSVTSDDSSQK